MNQSLTRLPAKSWIFPCPGGRIMRIDKTITVFSGFHCGVFTMRNFYFLISFIFAGFAAIALPAHAHAAAGCSINVHGDARCDGAPPPTEQGGGTPGPHSGQQEDFGREPCPGGQFVSWSANGHSCTTQSNYATSATSSARLPQGRPGQSVIMQQWQGATRGHAFYQCRNGAWTFTSGTCSPAQGCMQGLTASWSGFDRDGNVVECRGTINPTGTLIPLNGTVTGRSTTPGTTGEATYRCENGSFTRVSASCSR